jgi:CDP-diacylglycerol--glycerol-3-phosphate 3-phosphatidyltransferase
MFYTLILIRILPVMWVVLPKVIWVAVGAVLAVRITAYLIAAYRYKRFSSMHTYMNKFTGLMVFVVPYAIGSPIAVPYCWCVVAVAMLSSLEELMIHVSSKEYDSGRKMLLWKSVNVDPEK